MMEELQKLRNECLGCRKCLIGGKKLEEKVSNVFSNMNAATIMVVGQNPGREEVAKGEPFVGVSGKFFDAMIKEIVGIDRSSLYISNTVRCLTPENRKPYQNEVNNCREFLDREIAIVKPRVIVALGGPAFQQLTGMNGLMKHHGNPVMSPRYGVPVFPMLHPSPLNTNDPVKRAMFMDDLKKLKAFMDAGFEVV